MKIKRLLKSIGQYHSYRQFPKYLRKSCLINCTLSYKNKINIICKSQYGFRREHSIEFANLKLKVNTEMDNNEIPLNIPRLI